MHTHSSGQAGFKRQVVFRISAEEWPLLEAAARKHGSIQAAILAGIRALTPAAGPSATHPAKAALARKPTPQAKAPASTEQPAENPDEEIRAREAARLLGLKTDTVAGYIRSGRLPGRYDGTPTWHGWLTTRTAVHAYQHRTHRPQ